MVGHDQVAKWSFMMKFDRQLRNWTWFNCQFEYSSEFSQL